MSTEPTQAPDEPGPFTGAYTEERMRDKLSRQAVIAGREVVGKSLLLYYALQREQTPAWAKATIIGALGYFITPLDAIMDLTPGVGYTDDLGVLVFAIATVSASIDDAVRARATARLNAWFGDKGTPTDGKLPE